MRATRRLRRQPPPGPAPGGDHLAARVRLRLRHLAHPVPAQPAQLRRAGRGLAAPSLHRRGRRGHLPVRPLPRAGPAAGRGHDGPAAPGRAQRPPGRRRGRLRALGRPARQRATDHLGGRAHGRPADGPDRPWPGDLGHRPAGPARGRRPERRGHGDATMPDRIELRGLRALGLCGILPEEGSRAQPLEVDLDIEADLSVPGGQRRGRGHHRLLGGVRHGRAHHHRRALRPPGGAGHPPGRGRPRRRAGRWR